MQDCDRYADDRLELESDVKALVEVQVPNVKKREALWRSWGGSYVSIKGALRDDNPARLQAFFDFLDTSDPGSCVTPSTAALPLLLIMIKHR